MLSIGEVFSIGRTWEEAIQSAIRSIDAGNLGFIHEQNALMSIDDELQTPSDQRMFAIANAMHAGYSVEKIWELTKIDRWFLTRLKRLSDFNRYLSNLKTFEPNDIRKAKQMGYADKQLASLVGVSASPPWSLGSAGAVRKLRLSLGIHPVSKMVDTCAAVSY
jgi:carbamoyl-phosphate synthase / aspartate carbamoyltransferase